MKQKETLWTKNFTLIIAATTMGAVGGIAANFALSFLVFDQTRSTLASGLIIAADMVPNFLIPLLAAPRMDRMPRKPFLVAGDAVNGILYLCGGLYLLNQSFSYTVYLVFSLLLSSLSAFDSLTFNSLYPKLIPQHFEQKGYTVSGMLYPTLTVIMTPIAALLYEHAGITLILLCQSGLSFLAAITESRIRIDEPDRRAEGHFSFRDWLADMKDATRYLKQEKGIQSIFAYMAVTNGIANGYSSILVAFFRTFPGFSVAMYSAFSVAEFAGRTVGGLIHYHVEIPPKKRFSFAFFVYQIYECMDAVLLWLPYPLMLANRTVCGFLGINSAIMREAAVQCYIPDELRAKLNAFDAVLVSAACGIFGLAIGALGEVLDYRVCISICGVFASLFCWGTIWAQRKQVAVIYNGASAPQRTEAPEK